jgi:hypothetical protein
LYSIQPTLPQTTLVLGATGSRNTAVHLIQSIKSGLINRRRRLTNKRRRLMNKEGLKRVLSARILEFTATLEVKIKGYRD